MRKNLFSLPKSVLLTHLGFLSATMIWGFAGPVIKLTLDHIPTMTLLFLRFLIVSLILLPYVFFELRKHKIHKEDYLNLFLLGIFSQTSIIIIFYALKVTTALDSTVIGILGLILSVYAGHYFYREKVDSRLTIGLIVASIGTLVVLMEPFIIGNGNLHEAENRFLGNFLSLIYTVTWVIYLIWSKYSMGEKSANLKKSMDFIRIKPMRFKYSPNLIVVVSFYVGLITIAPFAILENIGLLGGPVSNFNILQIDTIGFLGLFYLSVFSSIVAYLIYQWSLENGKIADSALYGYLGPVFTFPAAYFLLGGTPNTCMVIGGLLIASGVIIAEFGNN